MQSCTRTLTIILLFTGPLWALGFTGGAAHGQEPLKAGVAALCITPEEPVVLMGYAARTEPFTRVHDDLYVRVVALESEGQEALIISLDLCLMGHWLYQRITEDIFRAFAIPPEHVILNTTHTHGAPALQDSSARHAPADAPPAIARYTSLLKRKILDAAGAARRNLQPARIGFGAGAVRIGANRRAMMVDQVRLELDPDGPADHSMPVIRIDNLSGHTLALLFNQGTHGTVMSGKNMDLTGDWCGLASQYIEKAWGAPLVAPFLSGAAGDVNPVYYSIDDFKSNRRYAESLAIRAGDEAMRTARSITRWTGGPIRGVQKIVTVPGKPYQQLAGEAPDTPIRLSVLKVGNIVFTGASGEIFSEIGIKVKQQSPYRHTVFLGNCNGYSGYVPTQQEYARGGYEILVSVVQPGADAVIVNTLLDLLCGFQ